MLYKLFIGGGYRGNHILHIRIVEEGADDDTPADGSAASGRG